MDRGLGDGAFMDELTGQTLATDHPNSAASAAEAILAETRDLQEDHD